jgi:AAA15 family ATPase/GTPase
MPRLSQFTVENYKAIRNSISIEVKPLTILVGPNGSGKSSILEAIALFSQSMPERGNPLQLDGELVKIPSYSYIFNRKSLPFP